MARQKHDQIALGELLLTARLEMRLSRAEVAKETGIHENSLIRYERAGLEDGGQFPPSPKLAALVVFLGIDPLRALLACVPHEDYDVARMNASSNLWHHPDHDFVLTENGKLRDENAKMIAVVRAMLGLDNLHPETLDWLKSEVSQYFDKDEEFRKKLLARRMYIEADLAVRTPPTSPIKNGPDQKDPSRSSLDPKPKNAVGAASKKPPKGGNVK